MPDKSNAHALLSAVAPVETFFAFHPPGRSIWTALGHVEAFGRNADDTWWFYDPQGIGTFMLVAHRFDDVNDLLRDIQDRAARIYRVPRRTYLTFPSLLPMTCATQCGHLVGLRAWTPRGLERKLRALDAEVVHDSEGRSRR